MMEQEGNVVRAGMSGAEMMDNVLRLVFEGDRQKFEAFCDLLGRSIPLDTAAVLRGSSVTGVRWEDGTPFDADGPGTSDVDLTLVGGAVLDWFTPEGFYIPSVHTKPLSEKHPDIAPDLVELRQKLTAMVSRPVNIQATRDWTMFVREYLMGQPYVMIIGKVEPA